MVTAHHKIFEFLNLSIVLRKSVIFAHDVYLCHISIWECELGKLQKMLIF